VSNHPLSVQLYTVRDAVAADLDAALARIAAIGFRTVELYGFVERAAEYRDLLAKHGLVASSAHAPFLSQDAAPIFAAALEVGVTSLIDPMSDPALWTTREGIGGVAATLNERAKQAAEHGIRVGYHNHWWEPASVDGTPALEIFAGMLDPEVILEVDTYWVEVGGGSAVETLRRLGDRVQFIHVKDGAISQDNKQQVAVGDGRMPVLDILAAAPQAVPVVELDDFDGDVFDALSDSFSFLTANAGFDDDQEGRA
jgi:sugar phosphate isomerase/epimerase